MYRLSSKISSWTTTAPIFIYNILQLFNIIIIIVVVLLPTKQRHVATSLLQVQQQRSFYYNNPGLHKNNQVKIQPINVPLVTLPSPVLIRQRLSSTSIIPSHKMTASTTTNTHDESYDEVVDKLTLTDLSMDEITKLYYKRLQLDPNTLDEQPTLKKLQQIVEAHLNNIPFENIGQHSISEDDEIQRPDINYIINKVLINNRGGFCLELNVLLSYWLTEGLGYKIHLVPATVGRPSSDNPNVNVFNPPQTHVIPFCRTVDDNYQQCYITDVAFGEPAIHPLQYTFDIEQITPDNMKCKIIHSTKNNNDKEEDDTTNDVVTLYWYMNNVWKGRLQWKYIDATKLERTIWTPEEFQSMYNTVQSPTNIFTQKLIITKLTRYYKYTVAGTKYKITGPPRFPDNNNNDDADDKTTDQSEPVPPPPPIAVPISDSIIPKQSMINSIPVITYYFDGANDNHMNQLRIIIQTVFGIPENETKKINFIKSSQADPMIWDQL